MAINYPSTSSNTKVPEIPKDINTPGAWDTYEGWYGATREQLNPGMQSQGFKGMSSLADLTAQGHDWSGEKAVWQGKRDAWLKNNPIQPIETAFWGKKEPFNPSSRSEFGNIKLRNMTLDEHMIESGDLTPEQFQKKWNFPYEQFKKLPRDPQSYNPQDTTIANDPFSKDINYDTFNWMLKTYPGSGAAQWYLRNPTAPSSKNPFLKPGSFVPGQDLVKRDDKSKTEIARIESGITPGLARNPQSRNTDFLKIGSKGGSSGIPGTGVVV